MEHFNAQEIEPLLILSLILLAGVGDGRWATLARCPKITGTILAGTALGLTLSHGMEVAKSL